MNVSGEHRCGLTVGVGVGCTRSSRLTSSAGLAVGVNVIGRVAQVCGVGTGRVKVGLGLGTSPANAAGAMPPTSPIVSAVTVSSLILVICGSPYVGLCARLMGVP